MYRNFGKRLIDLSLTIIALVLLIPFIVCIALLLASTFRSTRVLFVQPRAGFRGNTFKIFKFRTMADIRDSDGQLLADGLRITRLGRFLRSTSLDELPELINVVRGEMSLVGPRPLLTRYLDRYTPNQARRHEVRPGVTGWAQVKGRNSLPWKEKFALDVWYVDNVSFGLDVKILLMTVWKVLTRDGINHGDSATMHEFLGD